MPKKKTADKRTYKRVWENGRWIKKPLQNSKFCKDCGFEKTWACSEHGCGSFDRVDEKKVERAKTSSRRIERK